MITGIPAGAERNDVVKEVNLLPLKIIVLLQSIGKFIGGSPRSNYPKELAELACDKNHVTHNYLSPVTPTYNIIGDSHRRHTTFPLLTSARVHLSTTLTDGLTRKAKQKEEMRVSQKRVDNMQYTDNPLWKDGPVRNRQEARSRRPLNCAGRAQTLSQVAGDAPLQTASLPMYSASPNPIPPQAKTGT